MLIFKKEEYDSAIKLMDKAGWTQLSYWLGKDSEAKQIVDAINLDLVHKISKITVATIHEKEPEDFIKFDWIQVDGKFMNKEDVRNKFVSTIEEKLKSFGMEKLEGDD